MGSGSRLTSWHGPKWALRRSEIIVSSASQIQILVLINLRLANQLCKLSFQSRSSIQTFHIRPEFRKLLTRELARRGQRAFLRCTHAVAPAASVYFMVSKMPRLSRLLHSKFPIFPRNSGAWLSDFHRTCVPQREALQ